MAANQASIGLQGARLLREQKRVASELDRRVAQRTTELAAANVELRKEIADRKHAEQDLRSSEEKHRLVVETANDAVVSMDDNGAIQFGAASAAGLDAIGAAEIGEHSAHAGRCRPGAHFGNVAANWLDDRRTERSGESSWIAADHPDLQDAKARN